MTGQQRLVWVEGCDGYQKATEPRVIGGTPSYRLRASVCGGDR